MDAQLDLIVSTNADGGTVINWSALRVAFLDAVYDNRPNIAADDAIAEVQALEAYVASPPPSAG